MGYIESTLMPAEEVTLKARIHWIVFMPSLLLMLTAAFGYVWLDQVILPMALFILALFNFMRAVIYFFTTELAVTNQRVIAKFGFIKRSTYEINLNRITSLNVDQSILGRLLNYGNVTVSSMGGMQAPIPAIVDPIGFRKEVLEGQ